MWRCRRCVGVYGQCSQNGLWARYARTREEGGTYEMTKSGETRQSRVAWCRRRARWRARRARRACDRCGGRGADWVLRRGGRLKGKGEGDSAGKGEKTTRRGKETRKVEMPPPPIRLIPKISRPERPQPAITARFKPRPPRPPAISYRPAHHCRSPFGTSSLRVASHAVQQTVTLLSRMGTHLPAKETLSLVGAVRASCTPPALKRILTRDLRHIIFFRHRSTISGMCHAPSIFAPTVPSPAQCSSRTVGQLLASLAWLLSTTSCTYPSSLPCLKPCKANGYKALQSVTNG